jgi:hypothetical protein
MERSGSRDPGLSAPIRGAGIRHADSVRVLAESPKAAARGCRRTWQSGPWADPTLWDLAVSRLPPGASSGSGGACETSLVAAPRGGRSDSAMELFDC